MEGLNGRGDELLPLIVEDVCSSGGGFSIGACVFLDAIRKAAMASLGSTACRVTGVTCKPAQAAARNGNGSGRGQKVLGSGTR